MIRLTAAAIWAARLSGQEKLLALAIDSTCDTAGRSAAGIPLLAELTGLSPRTVARTLDELALRDMLHRDHRPGLSSVMCLIDPTLSKPAATPANLSPQPIGTTANLLPDDITSAKLNPANIKTRPDPKKVNGIEYDWTTFRFTGIDEGDRLEWQEIYPAISVPDQLDRAAYWLRTNPERRKRNYRRFLNNWLAKAQDRGRPIR